jgi:hypothetical protein
VSVTYTADMPSKPPTLDLYRHVVDVLLAEHERSSPPLVSEGYPIHMLSCTWGIYAQINRFGRGSLTLIDSGLGHEANVLVRAMLEHTIMLHWIIERGDEGVDALIANQSKRIKAWFYHASNTTLAVPPELVSDMMAEFRGIDENKTIRTFEATCKEIGAGDLYAVYAMQSLFVHPTITTSNLYCRIISEDEAHLVLTPGTDSATNVSLIAHCLIWAGRDFDRLTPGHPRASDLEKLAEEISARPVLPSYQPVIRQGNRRSKRGKSGIRQK